MTPMPAASALLIVLPLLAGVGALLLPPRLARPVALATAAGLTGLLAALTRQVIADGPFRYSLGGWEPPLGISLYVDGLALVMLWLTLTVGATVTVYSIPYYHRHAEQGRYFWVLWSLLWAGLNGLFMAADLFNLYVLLELITLAAVPLVTLGTGRAAARAALRYLIVALAGSLFYLLGVALAYGATGMLDLYQLTGVVDAAPEWVLVAALMTIGLLAKGAAFPLHVWLPEAHANAPTPASAVLSALVVKAAFYILLRLWFWPFDALITPQAAHLLGGLGLAAILYGSVRALRQVRLKMVVAYSTVAQLGYLLLIFPLAGALAWQGVVYHGIAHGLAKSAMFLAAGNVLHVLGHDRIQSMPHYPPVLAVSVFAFGLAGVSLMGLPPSGGFVAKWLLVQAAIEQGLWWWAAGIILGGLLAAGYVARAAYRWFDNSRQWHTPPREPGLSPLLSYAPLVLAIGAMLLGLAAAPVLGLLEAGAPAIAAPESE